jgi:arginyl-tRNA synthetase
MSRFARQFAEILAPLAELSVEDATDGVTTPPQPDMGDLGFGCFPLAKQLRKAPPAIATDLAGRAAALALPAGCAIKSISSAGPYVNVFLDPATVAREVLPEVLVAGSDFGKLDLGHGGIVPVDFSAPNIAKPFGIHHLRSTVIGNALVRMLAAAGYKPVGINHIGDWGTQFGQLLAIWDTDANEEKLHRGGISYLLGLYVEFNRRKAEDPGLQDVARARFKDLEDGDAHSRYLWNLFREVSLLEFERVYKLLGIEFDDIKGESFYEDRMPAVLAELDEKGLLSESEEATVVDLEPHDLGVALVKKKDGATLYLTRDLAAAEYRWGTYDFVRSLYVVGAAQSLHFAQMKKVLELLGRDWCERIEHVPFGMMRFKDRKMATRSGDIILLEEVLNRAVELARETIEKGARDKDRPVPEDIDDLANKIGVGALMFNDLKNRRVRDVVFDWDEILSFEGATGPYLQYTAARIRSMTDRYGREPRADVDFSLLDGRDEMGLVMAIDSLSDGLRRGVAQSEPSYVADRLLDIAARFSSLYARRDWKVLTDDEDLTDARMLLAATTRQALVNGLDWLGIEVPERM